MFIPHFYSKSIKSAKAAERTAKIRVFDPTFSTQINTGMILFSLSKLFMCSSEFIQVFAAMIVWSGYSKRAVVSINTQKQDLAAVVSVYRTWYTRKDSDGGGGRVVE